MEGTEADILIVGGGGAALCAALHAFDRSPRLRIVLVVKGLLGKSGCTRMVQGGYNAVLYAPDSLEIHFADTIQGGAFLNDQELAWVLVTEAPNRLRELESRYGCFFDRAPDGRIDQKPFAGQSRDRTVHKGDLTGIEIMNRLMEQVMARGLNVLEEHRAVAMLPTGAGGAGGVLVLDIRRGEFLEVRARATLLATGGGPTMYRLATPSAEKSCDGMALALRAGAPLMDMEMVQFHPTGLLVGASLASGTILEEGLRGVGGRLYNGRGERFMERYDPVRLERATRDLVSRACYLEVMAGRGTPHGGVWLDMSHLGAEFVEATFPGMAERCRDLGFDLARGRVEVSPTAHFMMGGVPIDRECRTALPGLFAAGEDAAGVHGANRLGGNGVAESTVFGGIAGDVLADAVAGAPIPRIDEAAVRREVERLLAPLGREAGEDVWPLAEAMRNLMWEKVGVVRNGADLRQAVAGLGDLRERAARVMGPGGRAYNMAWNAWLDLESRLLVSEAIARSALRREESRGAHFRSDFPERADGHFLQNIWLRLAGQTFEVSMRPVRLTRMKPEAEPVTAG